MIHRFFWKVGCSIFLLVMVSLSNHGDLNLVPPVHASAVDNVSGFAWSPNVGWLSFNSTSDGSATGYGVTIDGSGFFSGYAWSSNFGWLSFNDADASHPAAQVQASGAVTGWARFLNNGAGWDGWVRFDHGQSNPVSLSGGELHGFAWSKDALGPGWISFNCAEGSTTGTSVCAGSPYKVTTTFLFNSPPATPLPISPANGSTLCGQAVTLVWSVFSDPNAGDTQSAYHVQVGTDLAFSSLPLKADDTISASGNSWTGPSATLPLGTTYFWRVQVQDNHGAWSAYATPQSFSIPSTLPFASFTKTASPTNPRLVTFTNTSSNATSFLWNFGDSASSTAQNVQHTYANPSTCPSDTCTVTLTATAVSGCTHLLSLPIIFGSGAVPQWRRWLPF